MIYFLLASGLTLTFGVLHVVNFAHGSFYMLGIFLCYAITRVFPFGISLLVIPICLALMGALAEFSLFRRIYKAEHVMQLLLSMGIIYIISDTIRIILGVAPKSVSMPSTFQGFYEIQGVVLPKYNIFIIVITILIALGMFLVLYRTKLGSIIRACTIDHEMTRCAGIDVSRVFLLVFAVGIGLAGLASATAAPIVTAILGMDMQMIVLAFCVVIIGGVGNIGGTLIAALIIGIAESLGILIVPQFAEVLIYVIVVVTLFIRPSGLFGKLVG
jgi:branched-chain amino acid transport system permease protein